jgi:hypothetical protein
MRHQPLSFSDEWGLILSKLLPVPSFTFSETRGPDSQKFEYSRPDPVHVAALAILIAMSTNMMVKLAIIFRAGRPKLLLVCALFFTIMLLGGVLIFFLNQVP